MAKRKRTKSGPGRSDRIGVSIEQMLDIFPDEASAVQWFENIRWGEGRYCPHCGGMDTYRTKSAKPQPFRCRDCESYFSIRTGTVMAHSNLPLRTWAIGVYLMSTSLKAELYSWLRKRVTRLAPNSTKRSASATERRKRAVWARRKSRSGPENSTPRNRTAPNGMIGPDPNRLREAPRGARS